MGAPALALASAAPDNPAVGATTNYTITFTLDADLPAAGSITITFNNTGFTLASTMIASSAEISGGILPATGVTGQSVTFDRDGIGGIIPATTSITLRIGTVTNPTTPNTYSLDVSATGGTSESANFSIVVGPKASIRINDAAGSGGVQVGNLSRNADQTIDLFASSYDAFGNFIGAELVNWTVSGGIGNLSNTSNASSTTLTLNSVGSGTVTADNGSGNVDATGTITVTPGALASIRVVEGSSGDGPEMGSRSVTTDQTLTVHAAGYDADGNYVGDQSVTWNVTGGIGAVSPGSGISTTFDARVIGTGTITATHAVGSDATGTITVSAGSIASIRIRNAPNNGGSEVGAVNLTADQTLTIFAASYDGQGNYLGDVSVSWSAASGNLAPAISGSGSSFTFSPTSAPRSGVIRATHASGTDDTGTISVSVGALSFVRINTGASGETAEFTTQSINADQTLQVHASGYDSDGNYINDVSVSWSVSGGIGTVAPSPNISTTLTATTVGTGVIFADHATALDDATGTITVTPGALASIRVVEGSSENGPEMGTRSVTTDQTLTVHAAGYDADGNYVGDQSVTWNVTGGIGAVSPGSGISTTFDARVIGTGTITATHAVGSDATGTITVSAGALKYVRINSDASGNTSEVTTNTMTVGGSTFTVHASGYDADDNYINDPSVSWSVTGGIGTLNPGSGPSTTLTATTPGTGVIQADHATAIDDATGTITVSAGSIASIRIRNAPNNGGSEVGAVNMTADESLTLYAASYDGPNGTGNYLGDVSVSWSLASGNLAPPISGSGSSFTFSPTLAPRSGVIRATHASGTDDTGTISVSVGALNFVRVYNGASGNTSEVTTATLETGQTLTVHAAGFDADGNYRNDESVNWSVTGGIGNLSANSGISTILTATTPGSGVIQADHATAIDDATGLITVILGNVDSIVIRDAPNNGGNPVTNVTLTADETITIYAAGYDAQSNYVGDVSVDWSAASGNLGPPISGSGSSLTFSPTTAPASGVIRATHVASGATDDTGTITVNPGVPVGTITLTPNPATLPADNSSTSQVTSSQILDGDGNPVGANRLFTVCLSDTNLARITTPDADLVTPGRQVTTNSSSQLNFTIQAKNLGGTVNIFVSSVGGTATGNTAIAIGSMAISSISTASTFVSRGQTGITVQMVVQNLSSTQITNLSASLTFTGSVDRTSQYNQVRTDGFSTIPASGQRTLTFSVGVLSNAALETITIDGQVNGEISGTPVSAQGAASTDSWTVQRPAELRAISVSSTLDTVVVGQQNNPVTVRLSNPALAGSAAAVIDNIQLKFLKDGVTDRTSDFSFTASGGNPTSIPANQQLDFNFTVGVGGSAEPGDYQIDVEVTGHDFNSTTLPLQDLNGADARAAWNVKAAPVLQIVSLTPQPAATVFAGQTINWTVRMEVRNNGPDPIDIDFAQAKTFIRFIIGTDRTSEYTIIQPTQLAGGGVRLNNAATGFIDFIIDVTGTTIGTATITGRVEGTDTGTGNPIFDDTNDGGAGVVEILSSTSVVRIAQTVPVTPNIEQGVGVVNTGQTFQVRVNVRNELQEPVVNVQVALETNGSSNIALSPQTIASIAENGNADLLFNVTAALLPNAGGETFTSRILAATGGESGQPALRGAAFDSLAIYRIQTRASLRVQFTELNPFQVAGDIFDVRATVTNTGQGQVDNTGQVTLTIPAGYSFDLSSPAVQNFTVGATILWRVIAPNTATPPENFTATITQAPVDINSRPSLAFLETPSVTRQVETQPLGLDILSFNVISPPGAVDNILSTEQTFDIRASLSVSANIDSVRADLSLPIEYSLFPGFSASRLLLPGQSSVTWRVIAPAAPHSFPRVIEARMRGYDQGVVRRDTTGELSIAAVVTRVNLDFDQFFSDPANVVSINQAFQIRARISNLGEADVEGTTTFTLDLGNTGIQSQQPLVQNVTPGQQVIWNVTAPATATQLDTLSLRVTSVPRDENTNLTAFINRLERKIPIATVDAGFVRINSVMVTTPEGAKDGTLSTEQELTIEAEIEWQDLINLQAEIEFPSVAYEILDGSRFRDIAQGPLTSVSWRVRAPTAPAPAQHFIKIKAQGNDENNPSLVVAALPDSLPFQVVQKAQLQLLAEISAPASARDSVLTVGQNFTIRAELRNSGDAALVGNDRVRITVPAGYTLISDSASQSILPEVRQVSWDLQAPDTPGRSQSFIIIEVESRAATDINSNQVPPLTPNPPRIVIPVRTSGIELKVVRLVDRKPSSISRDATNVGIFGLQFGNEGDAPIVIDAIRLNVRARGDTIAPNSVLSRLKVVDYFNASIEELDLTSLPDTGPLVLNFQNPISISETQPRSIEFRVDVNPQSTASHFELTIDNPQSDILARDTGSNRQVEIVDATGPIVAAISSGVSVIFDPTLEASFYNYPNPFGDPGKPTTAFNYRLDQPSDISLKIYTLLGELVWSISFSATDLEGLAGTHAGNIIWDGRNEKGQKVLNGVYVAVLTTNRGKVMTKIAVAN